MIRKKHFRWLALLACLLMGISLPVAAQETDDLQEYLDQLAAEQAAQSVKKAPLKGASVEIPVELTVIDLSQFSSYQNRKKQLSIRANVKFTNGVITAASNYSGGDCLLKIFGGATVAIDETAGVNASAVTANNCFAAVGIYEGSTFYQAGDVRAPIAVQSTSAGAVYANIAVYLDTSGDVFYYVSGLLDGIVYNPNNGTIVGLAKYTKEELQAMLAEIDTRLAYLQDQFNQAEALYLKVADLLPPEEKAATDERFATVQAKLNELSGRSTALYIHLQSANKSEYNAIYDQIMALVLDVNTFQAELIVWLNDNIEYIKSQLAADIQQQFNSLGANIVALETYLNKSLKYPIEEMKWSFSDYYFTKQATEEFSVKLSETEYYVLDLEKQTAGLVIDYNNLVNNSSISKPEDAIAIYNSIEALTSLLTSLEASAIEVRERVDQLKPEYDALPVKFPDEFDGYTIRPVGLEKELQMGFKSNRGFVLTSAGIMVFEQVEGATFRLKDYQDNYVVYDPTTGSLSSSEEATEATVWRGYCVGYSSGIGHYGIAVEGQSVYLTSNGSKVNDAFSAKDGVATRFTITEGIDELQAFLNMLAEEAEEGGETGQPTDTLFIDLPTYNPDGPAPTTPFVFPKVPYPIWISGNGGTWTIPTPTPGQPRPENFHPIYIPWGSHVIIDDVTFRDIVGGHHVIYVEGVLEINITINIYISNWEWFINVGPGGRVIWKPTGGDGTPRIKVATGGTFDFQGGQLDYVENHGTVNQTTGIVWRVYNFSGGIYNMTGGSIINNVVASTETVFINHGTFYFYGGIIGGYGDRLIYHGPGATLRIDGGRFDFTHVTHYWIEAHNHFYIRGDYDYGPTVPILLADKVTIRILYKWIYKFNIVFINGRPVPRYPIFWGDGFTLTHSHFINIGWTLPNNRWRWYVNELENTIEPRDEEVDDEDDLQAYLDWLAEHQDDEAASSEEQPQQLDLGGRVITITRPVEIPTGVNMVFVNGTFRPGTTWTGDRVFYIPATTTVRFERVVIDFSSTTYYVVNGIPVQRNIFAVYGIVHFGVGSVLKGYFNPAWTADDNAVKGSVVFIDPSARFYLDGGRFDNVVFWVNTIVNIFVNAALTTHIHLYLPSACRYVGFQVLAAAAGYNLSMWDLSYIHIYNSGNWGVELNSNGQPVLFDLKDLGDLNADGCLNVADIMCTTSVMANKGFNPRADMNQDGKLTFADIMSIINAIHK